MGRRGKILFCGIERDYEYVKHCYDILRSNYADYVAKHGDGASQMHKRYILDYKKRLDDMIRALGLRDEVQLPKGISPKFKMKQTNGEQEQEV